MSIDKICFGMKNLNLSQAGTALDGKSHYSHHYYQLDLAGKDTGREYWYNNLKETYFKNLGTWSGGPANTVFFGTADKNGNQKAVRCADGVDRVLTLGLTHDWNLRPAGQLVAPGEAMYLEGAKGHATGNHIHVEVTYGWTTTMKQLPKGDWCIRDIMDPRKIFYILDGWTNVMNLQGLSFVHTSQVNIPDVTPKPQTDSKLYSAQSFDKSASKGVKYYTTADNGLNLRRGSATSTESIILLPKGTELTWYGYYTGDWYFVAAVVGSHSYTGFVHKNYISKTKTATTKPATPAPKPTTKPAPAKKTMTINGYVCEVENGTATFTVDRAYVRLGAPNGQVVATYRKGQSVNYYAKYVGNGKRYVVYGQNRRLFVPVNGKEDRSEPWATIKLR